MASEPRTSPESGALGAALADRVRPRVRSGRLAAGAGIGLVGSRSVEFGHRLGLSTVYREVAADAPVGRLDVRPPIEYWPWDEESAGSATTGSRRTSTADDQFVSSGDRRLDALRQMIAAKASTPTPARRAPEARRRPVRRGLPSTLQRRGTTAAGSATAPGAIAQRMTPESVGASTGASGPTTASPGAARGPSSVGATGSPGGPGPARPGTGTPNRRAAGTPAALQAPAAPTPFANPTTASTRGSGRSASPWSPTEPEVARRAPSAQPTASYGAARGGPSAPGTGGNQPAEPSPLDSPVPLGDGWDRVRAVRRLVERRAAEQATARWPGDQPPPSSSQPANRRAQPTPASPPTTGSSGAGAHLTGPAPRGSGLDGASLGSWGSVPTDVGLTAAATTGSMRGTTTASPDGGVDGIAVGSPLVRAAAVTVASVAPPAAVQALGTPARDASGAGPAPIPAIRRARALPMAATSTTPTPSPVALQWLAATGRIEAGETPSGTLRRRARGQGLSWVQTQPDGSLAERLPATATNAKAPAGTPNFVSSVNSVNSTNAPVNATIAGSAVVPADGAGPASARNAEPGTVVNRYATSAPDLSVRPAVAPPTIITAPESSRATGPDVARPTTAPAAPRSTSASAGTPPTSLARTARLIRGPEPVRRAEADTADRTAVTDTSAPDVRADLRSATSAGAGASPGAGSDTVGRGASSEVIATTDPVLRALPTALVDQEVVSGVALPRPAPAVIAPADSPASATAAPAAPSAAAGRPADSPELRRAMAAPAGAVASSLYPSTTAPVPEAQPPARPRTEPMRRAPRPAGPGRLFTVSGAIPELVVSRSVGAPLGAAGQRLDATGPTPAAAVAPPVGVPTVTGTTNSGPAAPNTTAADPAPAKRRRGQGRSRSNAAGEVATPAAPADASPAAVVGRITGPLTGLRRSVVAPGPGALAVTLAASHHRDDVSPVLRSAIPSGPSPAGRPAASLTAPAGEGDRASLANSARSAPAASPGPDLAATFLEVLSRRREEAPRPLPVQFRPIAAAVAPGTTPKLSTSAASRAALAAVGKQAATTGDVIHLARMPAGTPTANEAHVLAHELTHVAHASPAPRFFADDRPSAEERRAEEIGRIMRRAPILPRAAAAVEPVAPLTGRATASMAPPDAPARLTSPSGSAPAVRRSVSPRTNAGPSPRSNPPSRSSSPGTVSAADLAARIMGQAPPTPAPAPVRATSVRRSPSAPARRAAPVTEHYTSPTKVSRAPAPVVRRMGDDSGSDSTTEQERFERMLDLLEERIIIELERRGGRFRGGF